MTTATESKKRKYILRHGKHRVKVAERMVCGECNNPTIIQEDDRKRGIRPKCGVCNSTNMLPGTFIHKVWASRDPNNNVVESELDLEAIFNVRGFPPKFELLREQKPIVKTVVVDLDTMTEDELRQHAEEEEYDIPETVKTRADLLRAIRAARAAAKGK